MREAQEHRASGDHQWKEPGAQLSTGIRTIQKICQALHLPVLPLEMPQRHLQSQWQQKVTPASSSRPLQSLVERRLLHAAAVVVLVLVLRRHLLLAVVVPIVVLFLYDIVAAAAVVVVVAAAAVVVVVAH